MKKLLFLILLASAAWTVQAQTAKHHCSGAASSASVEVSDEAIAQAASLDESIERRVCETSGKVSYYRKDVCQKSGKVSYEPVNFDAATNQFVNASPSEVGSAKKSCCASKGAAATAASTSEKACAGSKSDKSCCASKGAKATTASNDSKGCAGSKAGKSCCAGKSAKGASASVAPTAKNVKND